MSRIAETFARLRSEGRTGLITYVTCGYPSLDSTAAVVPALAAGGADLIELGVPFSDPLADGPTIQKAGFQALENGVTLQFCLETVRDLRANGVTIPLVLMGYYNPILKLGPAEFARQAAAAGVDGVIVPDLIPEEAGQLAPALEAAGVDLIFLLAPTSTDERIAIVSAVSRGFVYCVSLTGVTGARARMAAGLADFVARVRARTDLPIAIGFGIATPEQFVEAGAMADAVVIGSAAIDRMGELPPDRLAQGMGEWAGWITGRSVAV